MVNFEQTGSWIPDVSSIKLTFSLSVTFYLTKTENRTKKPLTQHTKKPLTSHTIALVTPHPSTTAKQSSKKPT